jgi:hypothetical protein
VPDLGERPPASPALSFLLGKWLRTGPLECFEEVEFVLLASPPEPYHYDVAIGTELTVEVVERFEQCFENQARRNPAWRPS